MARSSRPSTAATVAKLVGILVVAGVLAAGALMPYVGGLGFVARQETGKFLDQPCNLSQTAAAPLRTTIYASDGRTKIASLFVQDRQPVTLAQVPKVLQQALIATEDRRFYSHQGVDMRGLIRSALNTTSGDTQGGSTLTMQYVKQERFYQATGDPTKQKAAIDQNINRKIEDAKCAIEIEKTHTKDQILEAYLNIAFFGENSYSLRTASRTYFGKDDVSKLTLAESALLVGVLRAPTDYDPFLHLKAARARRDQVIDNLLRDGHISAAAATAAKANPPRLATDAPPPVKEGCANSDSSIPNVAFFCDYVVDWLTDPKHGNLSVADLTQGGLSITTTLDPTLQSNLQNSLWAQMPAAYAMTAVMPVVDPRTGNVLAMATSKRYGTRTSDKDRAHTQVPLFTTATTGAASTYKLFTMLAALKAGATPDLRLGANSPDHTQYITRQCGAFTARNVEGEGNFTPNETMASAIAKSSNTYFVALEDQFFSTCDLKPAVDTALGLGMTSLTAKANSKQTVAQQVVDDSSATFTLGPASTSPLELTGAYAAIANDGVFNAPAPVTRIVDHSNKVIDVKRTPASKQMSPQIARTARQLLVGDTVSGTAAAPFAPYYAQGGSPVAGKTGTNGDASDKYSSSLWFVGTTPTAVATTAVINLDKPTAAITALPNVDPAQAATTLGAYAAQMWVTAMSPYLLQTHWSIPTVEEIEGTVDVPSVLGQPLDQAEATLKGSGFQVSVYANGQPYCGAPGAPSPTYAPFTVAYQQPLRAAPGDTITVCLSNGMPMYTYEPPKVITPPRVPGGTTRPGQTQPGGRTTAPPRTR